MHGVGISWVELYSVRVRFSVWVSVKQLFYNIQLFFQRPSIAFEPGMKVEVVDKRNPLLVRVATITERDGFLVKIHFDGWMEAFDYWLEEDSPDIHPPGWCAKTNHPLMPPISESRALIVILRDRFVLLAEIALQTLLFLSNYT